MTRRVGRCEEGAAARTNANGDALSLKFTTTNAQFRQTWSAVAIQQLADCGIQIIPTYAPASWWFGDTTGLNRRDYELGAYAWVGEAEPGGRSLYSCDQIPIPANNWQGQNTMGWCNEAASNAIVKANNTLLREDRIPQYDIVQKEFAKDVVSIPIFQRAEAEAWSANLEGPAPDPTDYTTWNIETWKLADGGDTIVLGMTQEPDSMWQAASSMAASAQLRKLMGGTGGGDNARIFSQLNYDFQPGRIRDQLSTIEAGLATNNDVEVKAGDMVYDVTGQPVTLEQGRQGLRQGRQRGRVRRHQPADHEAAGRDLPVQGLHLERRRHRARSKTSSLPIRSTATDESARHAL